MRLFAAIKISEEVKESLIGFREKMSPQTEMPNKVKWVESSQIHLTLKFFGEVEATRLASLQKALFKSVQAIKSFSFGVCGIGVFPQKGPPRVLWAGISEPTGTLGQCASSVEGETVQSGFFPADKPFSGHVTLARFSVPPGNELTSFFEKTASQSFGKVTAERMVLVESRLSSQGPRYIDLTEFPFGKPHEA